MDRSRAFIVFGFLVISLCLQGFPVSAHEPIVQSISFRYASNELTVEVTHSVDNVSTHYIKQIVVEKNSVVVLTRDYTRQNTTSGMSAVFIVEAGIGDILEVTAKCSISGEASQDLNLGNVYTGDRTLPDETVFIISAVVILGILAVVFAFVKQR